MNAINQETMQFIKDTILNFPYKQQPFAIGKDWNEMSFKERNFANYEFITVLLTLAKPLVHQTLDEEMSAYRFFDQSSKPALFFPELSVQKFSENVRTVTFIHLYNTCISEIYGSRLLTLKNGTVCTLAEFIEVLYELRKRSKLSYKTREFDLLKGVVNSLFRGCYRLFKGYNGVKVEALGREKIEDLADHIDANGGVVLQINVDGIIYVSEKVLVPDSLFCHSDVLDWYIPLANRRSVYSSHGVVKTSYIPTVNEKRLERIRNANYFKKHLESNHGI